MLFFNLFIIYIKSKKILQSYTQNSNLPFFNKSVRTHLRSQYIYYNKDKVLK